MKKLIFISLVILFAICSKSWALPECEGSPAYKWTSVIWNNCIGTYTWTNGLKYAGEWKDDYWHGQGSSTYASGTKYVGEFKYGRRNGKATLTYADGRVWQGKWRNGEWVSGKKYAAGEYNPAVKEDNKKQNINPNEIINE